MAERDAVDACAADVAAAVERERAARARIGAASTDFAAAAALHDATAHVAAGAHRAAVVRRDAAAARLAETERIAGIACAPRTLLRLPDRDAAERRDHHRGLIAAAAAAHVVADADAAVKGLAMAATGVQGPAGGWSADGGERDGLRRVRTLTLATVGVSCGDAGA